MSLRITTRLTLWYLLLFGSVAIFLSVARHLLFVRGEKNHLDQQAQTYTELLLSTPYIWGTPIPNLAFSLDSLSRVSELQYRCFRFFLHNGQQVLYDNAVRDNRAVLLDSLRHHIGGRKGFSTVNVDAAAYRTYTAVPKGLYAGKLYLTVIIPRDELNAQLQRLGIFLAIGIASFLGIAWVGGLLLTRRSLALVEEMRRTAAEITGTNLAQRVPVGKSQDELTALARTFNSMIERLQHYSESYRLFVTNTSHDLRTPLTIIRAELQLGMEDENLSPELEEMIRHSMVQLDRLDRLTADVLFFAKLETDGIQLRTQPVKLDELILDCTADMQRLMGKKNLTLDITLSDDLAVNCQCDDHMIRRAVVNLLDNAINYSPERSTIRVSLENIENEAHIVVQDFGTGMEEEEASRAVERLYRGPASHGLSGSGLGLAITKEIVEAHRGRLIIHSALGEGTTVTIVLPLNAPLTLPV